MWKEVADMCRRKLGPEHPVPRWPKELQHTSSVNTCTSNKISIVYQSELWSQSVNRYRIQTRITQQTRDKRFKEDCEFTLKNEIWRWNWGKWSGNLHLSVGWSMRTCARQSTTMVPNQLGCLESRHPNLLVWGCVLDWSIPIVDPRVPHLFYAICHIYYSYICIHTHTHTHTHSHTFIRIHIYIY